MSGPSMPLPYDTAPVAATPPGDHPQPPPGPGVVPPFAAPPTDGTRQRRWLAVGLATGFVLVVCVGALFGVGALVVFTNQLAVERSQAVVTDHLNAIKAQNYDAAYDGLCPAVRSSITKQEFSVRYGLSPDIDSFTVGQPTVGDPILVPVEIRFTDGSSHNATYQVVQGNTLTDYQVCSVD